MAKTKAKEIIEVLELVYELHSLPTAQHKAGLAGLAMLVRWLGPEGKRLIPQACEVGPNGASFRFTAETLRIVFNHLYAGQKFRIETPSKWAGAEPIEEIVKDIPDKESGKVKQQKYFIYEIVQPSFDILQDYFVENKDWLKLWREMCWATTRAVPKTRLPYEKTADGSSSGVAEEEWLDLTREVLAQREGQSITAPIAGSVFVGAQATNAEFLTFEGFPKENLLLHCWILAILVFCPRSLNRDGQVENRGFLLAFPEVSDLEGFVQDYRLVTNDLGQKSRLVGIRPSGALLDVAAESALQFVASLSQVAHRAGKQLSSVSSVEYFHLEKQGNSVKGLEVGKVVVKEDVLKEYQLLTETGRFSSFLFRRGLIQALLGNCAWYLPFRSALQDMPDWAFLQSAGGGPKGSKEGAKFASDCRQKFLALAKLQKGGRRRVASKSEAKIERIVHRMVGRYLKAKSLDATNESWDLFPRGEKGYVKPSRGFLEQKARLGRALFLELRSRRDFQFIEHFSATLGSVGQFIPPCDFIELTRHLRDKPDDIKVLTLLAISAHSYYQEDK